MSGGFWGDVGSWIRRNVVTSVVYAAIGFVGAYVLNVWMLARRYEGTNVPDGSPVTTGSIGDNLQGMLFYAVLSSIVFGAAAYRRNVGPEQFWSELRTFPAGVRRTFAADGSMGLVHLLWGVAAALLVSQLLTPALSGVLAIGVAVVLPTFFGRVLLSFAGRVWHSALRRIQPARHAAPPTLVSIAVSAFGVAAALALGFFVTEPTVVLVLAVGAAGAAVALSRSRSGAAPTATALIIGAAIGLALVLDPGGALADDGGFVECGSSWAEWRNCPGADGVLKDSVAAAVAAGVPAGVINAVLNIGYRAWGSDYDRIPRWLHGEGEIPDRDDPDLTEDGRLALDVLDRVRELAEDAERNGLGEGEPEAPTSIDRPPETGTYTRPDGTVVTVSTDPDDGSTSTTVVRPDGSSTQTFTSDGETSTTETRPDGSSTMVETLPDGSTRTSEVAPDGTVTFTTRDPSGNVVESSVDRAPTETTETRPDGTVVTVSTDPDDGSTSTTVVRPDGSSTQTFTSDGATTTTETRPDGSLVTTTTHPDGSSTVTETRPDGTIYTIDRPPVGDRSEAGSGTSHFLPGGVLGARPPSFELSTEPPPELTGEESGGPGVAPAVQEQADRLREETGQDVEIVEGDYGPAILVGPPPAPGEADTRPVVNVADDGHVYVETERGDRHGDSAVADVLDETFAPEGEGTAAGVESGGRAPGAGPTTTYSAETPGGPGDPLEITQATDTDNDGTIDQVISTRLNPDGSTTTVVAVQNDDGTQSVLVETVAPDGSTTTRVDADGDGSYEEVDFSSEDPSAGQGTARGVTSLRDTDGDGEYDEATIPHDLDGDGEPDLVETVRGRGDDETSTYEVPPEREPERARGPADVPEPHHDSAGDGSAGTEPAGPPPPGNAPEHSVTEEPLAPGEQPDTSAEQRTTAPTREDVIKLATPLVGDSAAEVAEFVTNPADSEVSVPLPPPGQVRATLPLGLGEATVQRVTPTTNGIRADVGISLGGSEVRLPVTVTVDGGRVHVQPPSANDITGALPPGMSSVARDLVARGAHGSINTLAEQYEQQLNDQLTSDGRRIDRIGVESGGPGNPPRLVIEATPGATPGEGGAP